LKVKFTQIPILIYHEISAVNNLWCVSPDHFKQQLDFLKKNGYKTISLTELKKGLEQNKETAEKLVVLTFDDARKGVYASAYPKLKEHGFTATIFIVPDWIEGKSLQGHSVFSEFLSWEELKELSENDFELGSHTLSHQNLMSLNETDLIKEINESKRIIENKLNRKINSFSYPYGKYNHSIIGKIKESYEIALTTNRGFSKKDLEFSRQWVLRDTTLEQFQKLLTPPKLSLCLITKNEENNLPSCLNSVKDLADEIIVVDTGSKDKTKEIARQFTDKIYDFVWSDDFSAARNESLKHASGDWILVLDADEIIAVEDHQKIKEAINDWNVSGYRVMTKNYSNQSSVQGWLPARSDNQYAKDYSGWHPSFKVRLFQRKDNFSFVGEVHELVDASIEKSAGKISLLKVPVHHYGLDSSKDKIARYLELTSKKIKDDPENAKAYFEAGIQYKELGNLLEAESFLRRSLRLDPQPFLPRINLALVLQKQGKLDLAIENYKMVLTKNKDNAEAYSGLGFCYFKMGGLEKSAEHFSQAIKFNPLLLDAYLNLGGVYEKLGKLAEAESILKKVIHLSKNNPRAYHNLGVVYEKAIRPLQALFCYEKAIELNYPRKDELIVRVEKIKQFLAENQ